MANFFSAVPRFRERTIRQVSILISILALALSMLSLSSCTSSNDADSAAGTFSLFVKALNRKDLHSAASFTSYPELAEKEMTQIFEGLHPQKATFDITGGVEFGEGNGLYTLKANWHFDQDKDWDYITDAKMSKLSMGWRISWRPECIVPGLERNSSIKYVRTYAAAPRVTDDKGEDLMSEQPINAILLDPALMPDPQASSTALASVLTTVAPLITAQSLDEELKTHPGQRITAVLLRDGDFVILEKRLRAIPGVIVERQPKLILNDRRLSSPAFEGIKDFWQQERERVAGWGVHITNTEGVISQPAGYQGPPGPDIGTTLDPGIQLAAQEAVVSVGEPAAIVVMQPSTGSLLAVAQNNQADAKGPIAFNSQYSSPTAQELMFTSNHAANADEDLARQLGLGAAYSIPGLTSLTEKRGEEDAANLMPSSKTTGSITPLGLAYLGATIASGNAPSPMVITHHPGTTSVSVSPSSALLDQMKGRMNEVVRNGSASDLKQDSDLLGLTSSAVSHGPGWFVGIKGDLAFAVLIEDVSNPAPAVKMAGKFLHPPPSR